MPDVNEVLQDRFIAHAVYLRRVSTQVVRQILKVLNQADSELFDRLSSRLLAGQTQGFTTDRLRALLNDVRVVNAAAYLRVKETLEGELLDLASYESEFVKNLVEQQLVRVGLPLSLIGVSPQTLKSVVTTRPWQGKILGQHVSDQARRRLKRIRAEIQQGVVQGLTNDEMIRRIRGTRALKFRDGALEVSRHEAEALARTSVAAVTGEARDELYRANADIVEGEQWVAILDGRATLVCQSNSQATRSLDPETGQWSAWSNGYAGGYPAHWNERSTLVPTLRGYQELGLDVPKVEEKPRVVHTSRISKTRRQVRKDIRAELRAEDPAAWSALSARERERRITAAVRQRYADLSGKVPAGTTYPEWLKKQPREFVEEVLGPTRAEAFLSGKLAIDRFVDDFGKPLTLKQLGLIEGRPTRFRPLLGDPDLSGGPKIVTAAARAAGEALSYQADSLSDTDAAIMRLWTQPFGQRMLAGRARGEVIPDSEVLTWLERESSRIVSIRGLGEDLYARLESAYRRSKRDRAQDWVFDRTLRIMRTVPASLPEDATLWRGLSGNTAKTWLNEIESGDLVPGSERTLLSGGGAVLAASVSANNALRFTERVLLKIRGRRGLRGVYLEPITSAKGELEWVTEDERLLRVLSIEERGNLRIADCEIVGP